MSTDEQTPEEAVEANETDASGPVVPTMMGHEAAPMRSLLSRPSDVAARPGFRAPSNKKTKAQKKSKKKGKKRR